MWEGGSEKGRKGELWNIFLKNVHGNLIFFQCVNITVIYLQVTEG